MVGIDVSGVTAHVAQFQANGIAVACADVRSLPFADRTFDVVVSNLPSTTSQRVASSSRVCRSSTG